MYKSAKLDILRIRLLKYRFFFPIGLCTFKQKGLNYFVREDLSQNLYACNTCNILVCYRCLQSCHKDHNVTKSAKVAKKDCECGPKEDGICDMMQVKPDGHEYLG